MTVITLKKIGTKKIEVTIDKKKSIHTMPDEDGGMQFLIALASSLGYEPYEVLNLEDNFNDFDDDLDDILF